MGDEGKDFLVVGDWTTVDEKDAKAIGVPVHDVLKTVPEYGDEDEDWKRHPRFKKYLSLQNHIEKGDEKKALEFAQSIGWELDALKVRFFLFFSFSPFSLLVFFFFKN